MPGINFTELRQQITMSAVLQQIDFQPVSRCGAQWRGPCPVHGSSSPQSRSFSVNVEQGRYHCHSCRSHGHQLELWAAIHQLDIYRAAVDLCRVCGRDVPWVHRW